MTWGFQRKTHKTYSKNPLDSVSIEIRFHPLLRISKSQSLLADFQDKVRLDFPNYHENNIQMVNVSGSGANPEFSTSTEIQRSFSTQNEKDFLILSDNALRFASKDHKSRDGSVEYLMTAFEFLKETYGEPKITRLGMRYINIIRRKQIENDLGITNLSWDQIVSEEFLNHPNSISSNENTLFQNSIQAGFENSEGEMRLIYGLSSKSGQDEIFTFDTDRFISNPSEKALADIKGTLLDFTEDIFSIFHELTSDKLLAWMKEEK